MTPPPVPSIRKILVRVNNWIGDVVMITPSMRALRKRFPDAEITLLAKTWVLDALQGSPYCDRLLEYSRPGSHGGLAGRLRLIRELKRERFDLAVLFQKAFEAALFARAAGIPRRIGFRTDRRGWLLTDALDEPDEGHHVEHFLRIAGALGCDTSDRRLSFHLDQASRDTARRFLRATGSDGPVLRVAFHPGASKPPRAWHAERFAAVAARMARRHGAKVLLLGGEGDRPTLDSMSRRVGAQAILPPEGQTIKEMAAVLERCHLLVCNDSGPMHVAVALRIPVVAVFGPGHPSRTGPYTDERNFRVLYENYPCSPCRQKFFEECIPASSGKPFCLEDISEETVERACGEMLAWAGADGVRSGAFFSERASS